MSEQTITINGTVYDARTGLPVDKKTDTASTSESATPVTHPERVHHAHTVHKKTQKSHILNRQVVKDGAPVLQQARPVVKRSPHISKFAPHPSGTPVQRPTRPTMDIAPVSHPMVQKAHAQMAQSQTPKPAAKPSQVIKQEAISEALQKAPSHKASVKEHRSRSKFSRMASIASASLALLLLAGYFAYINMPHLSIRVAAAQAGINASYPEYKPDGYSLAGPIAYGQGEVDMKFASNSGPQNFTIKQTKTDWDSSAVQENYVKDKWGDDYMPYSEHGLTIYAHDGNAVWVNGGILYTIEGDAPLSSSQIRSLATSM